MEMKKVILSGGFAGKAEDGGEAFCKEIMIKNISGKIKILECLFARLKNPEAALESDVGFFKQHIPNANLEFELAQKDRFSEQIKNADVVYFRGGDTDVLYQTLSEIEGWQDALKDKIVIGASAGAYVLSDLYVKNNDMRPSLEKGFGLISGKTVAHYRSDFNFINNPENCRLYWDQVDSLMASTREDLRSIKLKEGEYVVL